MRANSYVSLAWAVLLAVVTAGCGSSSSSSQPKPSGLKKRVLLTNVQSGTINLLDAQKDTFTTKNFGASAPTKIITAGGQTVALDSTQTDITIFDNAKEQVTFSAVLEDIPTDIAITPDGKTAFAAERNLGAVQFATTADGSVSPNKIRLPAARLVMSPNGSKLLVFPDPRSQAPPNTHSFFIIDVASKGTAEVTSPNLDQPITAVFGSSDNQAFILNCGAECGGTAASVAFADFSGAFNAPQVPGTVGTPVAVPGATVGLLNGTSLFVAGTPPVLPGGVVCPLSRCGTLSVVNTSSLTAASPVAITDGQHGKMALANGRLYVGATGCTVDPGTAPNTVRGCLSIFNTGSPGVKFPQESSFRQNFDVTGMQAISNRNVIYIVQGGELDIFDTTTDELATGITQLDVVGRAIDLVQIDP
ncbi:MAG TPA: hypothetical protein VFR84_08110 [Candidatus Angelobacter sp.]|nr:hypothetical protein [Candidatus Angelobacter sp.]